MIGGGAVAGVVGGHGGGVSWMVLWWGGLVRRCESRMGGMLNHDHSTPPICHPHSHKLARKLVRTKKLARKKKLAKTCESTLMPLRLQRAPGFNELLNELFFFGKCPSELFFTHSLIQYSLTHSLRVTPSLTPKKKRS